MCRIKSSISAPGGTSPVGRGDGDGRGRLLLEARSLVRRPAFHDQPGRGPYACATTFCRAAYDDRGLPADISGACRAGAIPPTSQRSPSMFTAIEIPRRSALSLSKILMVPTVVIAVGPQYAVLAADELNPEGVIVNQFDPFGGVWAGPLPPPVRGYIWVRAGEHTRLRPIRAVRPYNRRCRSSAGGAARPAPPTERHWARARRRMCRLDGAPTGR